MLQKRRSRASLEKAICMRNDGNLLLPGHESSEQREQQKQIMVHMQRYTVAHATAAHTHIRMMSHCTIGNDSFFTLIVKINSLAPLAINSNEFNDFDKSEYTRKMSMLFSLKRNNKRIIP